MQLQMFTRPLSKITWCAFGMFQKAIFSLLLHIRPMAADWGELYKRGDHGNTFVVPLCYAGRTADDFKQESVLKAWSSGWSPWACGVITIIFLLLIELEPRWSRVGNVRYLQFTLACFWSANEKEHTGCFVLLQSQTWNIDPSVSILPMLLVPVFCFLVQNTTDSRLMILIIFHIGFSAEESPL